MAGGSLGSLTIDLAANITRFEKSLNRAEQLSEKRSRAIQRNVKRLAIGIGASLASFGFVSVVRQSLDFADSIGKTADKLGIATSSLQEYRFAAEQTGLTSQQLDTSIQRFARRLGEAQQGTGVLKDVLANLNIELRDQDGNFRSTEAVLDDYANAIRDAGNANEQLYLANKAFDTEGVAFVNTLKNGAAGLQTFRDEAQALGIVMDEDLIRNAERANDQLNIVAKVLQIELANAAVALAPAITGLAGAFASLTKGEINELPEWAKDTAFAFRVVQAVFEETGDSIGFLAAVVQKLFEGEFAQIGVMFDQRGENSRDAAAGVREYVDALFEVPVAEAAAAGAASNTATATAVDQTEKPNFFTGLTDAEMETELQKAIDAMDHLNAVYAAKAAERTALEETHQQAVTNARMNALQQGVALLQLLAGKSKGAALASIALSKGLMIAQTVMSTQAASMRAFAELGPIAGAPVAASIQAAGAASVALIAAQGLAQASQVSAGGASLGSVTNPVATTDANTFSPELPTQSGTAGTITINVNGVVTEEIMQDLVIPAIQDATNDKDVILFRTDSRQALELTA